MKKYSDEKKEKKDGGIKNKFPHVQLNYSYFIRR